MQAAVLAQESLYLYLRNLRNITRVRMAIIAPLFIPGFFFIINGFAFKDVIQIPGFSAESYIAFQVATAIIMTVAITSVGSGLAMVLDITSGYFYKLLLAPIGRPAILLSRLMTEATRVILQILVILGIALGLGVQVKAGIPGVLLILVIGVLWSVAYAAISLNIALRTRNAEATNASFMITFPLVFLTTAMMPKELYPEWLKVVVSINPTTYVLEGVRSLVLEGFQWGDIGRAFLAIAGVASITVTTAALAFRGATR